MAAVETLSGSTPAAPVKEATIDGHEIHLVTVQRYAWRIIGGLLAVLAVSGLYYALTQVHYYYWPGHTLFYLKPGWDGLFKQAWWPTDRHFTRNNIEGIVAAPAVTIAALSWRKHWDEDLASSWEVVGRLLAYFVVAACGLIIAEWFVTFGYAMIAHQSTHVHYVTPTSRLAEIEGFVIGFVAGQLARPIWKPAARTLHFRLCEPSVNLWRRTRRPPLWVLLPMIPPTARTRIAWMFYARVATGLGQARWAKWLLPVVCLIVVALIGTGIYARYFA
jgi:hypothetical protein